MSEQGGKDRPRGGGARGGGGGTGRSAEEQNNNNSRGNFGRTSTTATTKEDTKKLSRLQCVEDSMGEGEGGAKQRDAVRRLTMSSGMLDHQEEDEEDVMDTTDQRQKNKVLLSQSKGQQQQQQQRCVSSQQRAASSSSSSSSRSLHSSFLLTEVSRGREAQAELQRRLQGRGRREALLREQQRRRAALASGRHEVQLWKDMRRDAGRQNQRVRDRVFEQLQAAQRQQERDRRQQDEEMFANDVADMERQKAAMVRSVEGHQEMRKEAMMQQQCQEASVATPSSSSSSSCYDLFAQMVEKRDRDWKAKKEQLDYAARLRQRELEQEQQFQEYADFVIGQAAADGRRNLFALNRAKREGVSGAAGPTTASATTHAAAHRRRSLLTPVTGGAAGAGVDATRPNTGRLTERFMASREAET